MNAATGPLLEVTNLKTHFYTRDGIVRAVDGVSFALAEGTLNVLLGPSGCGKSTTLRLIAGLEAADAGTIRIGGRDVGFIAQSEHQAAHQPHHARHFGKRDRDDDVFDARFGERHQRDCEQHRRNRHQPVHDAHHDCVEPAYETGDEPDRKSHQRAEYRHGDAYGERHTGTEQDAAVDVASQHVGAEPELRRGLLQSSERCGGLRIDGAEPGREQRDEDHREQDDAAHDRGRMPAERIPEALPCRRDGCGRRGGGGRAHISSGCADRGTYSSDPPPD